MNRIGLLMAWIALLLTVSTAASEEPQYGGTLNVGTVYVTLSALSWDTGDWVWKQNHDSGMVREQLFSADLEKSIRKGGKYSFKAEAYLPADAMRGELAESWTWEQGPEDTHRLVIRLRQGVTFTARPGVMKARELDAEDVVYSYNLLNASPKKIATYFDHIDRVEARDRHTVVFHLNSYNAEWAYRFGYGYYSAIVPRETAGVDRKNWRNVVGTGPFTLNRYIQGNAQEYSRNPDYWDREPLDGERYPIPFIDKLKYRIIKDEATFLTALRTGKIDILETIRWIAVDHLRQSTPELKWARRLATAGDYLVMRVDQKPFDDLRVRRAMNLAIDQPEIVERYYGGHAELMAFPQHPEFEGYFQPLAEMPASVQELFSYNPARARQLLAEAGYPQGFSFKVQVCTCNPNAMDLAPLLDSYLNKVGVKLEIEPLEYASYLSLMTTRKHAAGYLMTAGHVNPTTTLRKNFVTGQTWNPSQYSDPAFDEKSRLLHLEQDEPTRQQMIREMTIEMLDQSPYIWLPTVYVYTAWWPWVMNYDGELRAGAQHPGPIYARIWIDLKMKQRLGFD